MKSTIIQLLKSKFLSNSFFITQFCLIILFNFIFPIIVLGVLNFEAVYLFDFQVLSLFYITSYCMLGVMWALGVLYYLVFESYKHGYVNGFLELKYSKKQVVLLFFNLIFWASLFYFLQVTLQTLIIALLYQDQGFSLWYVAGVLLYSFLLFALIYGSVFAFRLIFALSNFSLGIIIISFCALTPIISAILTSQTQAITINSFRDNDPRLINNGKTSDLTFDNPGEPIDQYEENLYQKLIYLDLANQVKSILDIFVPNNNYKKIKIVDFSPTEEFIYFTNYGSYGVIKNGEGAIENYKYYLDPVFLRNYHKEDFLNSSILKANELNVIESNRQSLLTKPLKLKIYFKNQEYLLSWLEFEPKLIWLYQNILAYLIFNLSNDTYSFDSDFMENKQIVLEINERGVQKIEQSKDIKEFLENEDIDFYTNRIVLLDENVQFDYQKENYVHQMNSEIKTFAQGRSFQNQIWNMNYNEHFDPIYQSEEQDFELSVQDDKIKNQYFNYLNGLFYTQQNILKNKLKSIEDIDLLKMNDNLFIKNEWGDDSPVAGINQALQSEQLIKLNYEELYPKYPFIIFWIIVSSTLIAIASLKIRKRNLL